MKRIISFLTMAVMAFSGFALADEGAEKKAELIFQNLNVLYEENLTYLKQIKDVWKAFVLEGKTSIDKEWFDKNIL